MLLQHRFIAGTLLDVPIGVDGRRRRSKAIMSPQRAETTRKAILDPDRRRKSG
jgi:hypothetical protein